MKYMGSKSRVAKDILPIMLAHRTNDMYWVEPFVGGANMIDKVTGNRIGSDLNEYLIEALKLIRDCPETIPDVITEDYYAKLKDEKLVDGITGFAAFAMSFGGKFFGGKFFGGYRRDVAGTKGCVKNMETQTRRSKQSAIRQSKLLQGVEFVCSDYRTVFVPPNSLIYCDPPYKGTTGYRNKFDHNEFWDWCRDMSKSGHKVFVSEYNAPEDFTCVWEKELKGRFSTSITGDKISRERLYTIVDGKSKWLVV